MLCLSYTFSDPDELLMVPYPADPLSLKEGDSSRRSAFGVSAGVLTVTNKKYNVDNQNSLPAVLFP